MPARVLFVFVFLALLPALRADLVLEQQFSEANHVETAITKLHDNHLRLDYLNSGISVIVNLTTRDSLTLLTNKTFLDKFGSEVRWEMSEEAKHTHGTNDMDRPAAPAVDTGKTEELNNTTTKIFTWAGAGERTELLWVATNFPNYTSMRLELAKLDAFNDSGPHRNAQPNLAPLPGMVVKSKLTIKGHAFTTTLVSANLTPVQPSFFELPPGYQPWKRPKTQIHETSPPTAH